MSPVFLPVGALEQHGPHLPLGTDALLAEAIASGVATQVGGIVAPALSYGYKSQPKCGGGQHFTGTTSLDAATLIGQTRDTVREFVRHGVQQLVIVNGHYENQWFLIEGIDLGLRDCTGATLQVMRLDYWDFCTESTLAKAFPAGFPGFALEHAAVIETSMMLHLYPDLVQLAQIPDEPAANFPPYETYPAHTEWVPASGVLSCARGATLEKGVMITEEVIARIAAAVRAESAT
jgi:creatinine amidohydrolase